MGKYDNSTDYTVGELVERFIDRTLYIGAGSSYMWIGDARDARFAIKCLDMKHKKIKEGRLKRARSLYRCHVGQRVDIAEALKYCEMFNDKEHEKKTNVLRAQLARADKKIETDEASIEYNEKYLNNWVPMWDRKVRDFYVRHKCFDYDVAGLAILMEGDESGTYWDIKEFNNAPDLWK